MRSLKSLLSAVCILAVLGPALAMARSSSETAQYITVGSGISSPSVVGGIEENPAGLIYNAGVNLQPYFKSYGGSSSSTGIGGHLFLGNGSVGAGLGYQRVDNLNVIDYGLGISMDALDMALGVNGSYSFTDGNYGGSSLNAGLLYKPYGKVTVGGTVYGLLDGVNGFGLGISYDASSNAILALDAATDSGFEAYSLKPALGLHLREFQMMVGYGVAIGQGRGTRIGEGISLGLGIRLSEQFRFEGYYDQFAHYYLGLMIRL